MTGFSSYLEQLLLSGSSRAKQSTPAPETALKIAQARPRKTLRGKRLLVGALLSFMGASSVCHAQNDFTGSPTIKLLGTGFSIIRAEERSSGEFPNDLNRKDCFDDYADYTLNVDENGDDLQSGDPKPTSVLFRPQVTNVTNRVNTIEIWVTDGSADCTSQDERGANTGGRCWLVAQSDDLTGNTVEIHARPRNIMRGNSDERTSIPTDPSEDICENELFNQRSLTFYLLVINGSDVETSTTWTGTIADNTAPPPPDDPQALPGDERLFVNWSVDTGQEDTDTLGFRFFCVEVADDVGLPSNDESSGDEESGGQGGDVDDGSTPCEAPELIPGEIPDTDFACGNSLGRTSREGRTDRLENGQRYALGIAGTDQIFNLGRLSELTCGTPEEVTTFFEAYREAGGKGGGGFCQNSWQSPSQKHLLWLLSALLMGLFLRRFRKGSEKDLLS